jgi:hypothetical protein
LDFIFSGILTSKIYFEKKIVGKKKSPKYQIFDLYLLLEIVQATLTQDNFHPHHWESFV